MFKDRSAAINAAQGGDDGKIVTSSFLVRLAVALGKEVESVALALDPEVARRTKYAVLEEHNDDGTITYRKPGIFIEGPASK